MVHIVTQENRSLYQPELDAMFRMRYETFVEGRGWNLPCEKGFEKDQFDRDDAVYLLHLDASGDLTGSMRLLPTTGGTILSDVFPYLSTDELPHDARIWESSRGHIGKNCSDKTAWHRITLAMLEFSLLWDVEKIVFVIDTFLLPKSLAVGWVINPLGPPTDVGGESYVACTLTITPESLRLMRDRTGIHTPSIAYVTGLPQAA